MKIKKRFSFRRVQRLYVCAHNLHGLHQPHLPLVPPLLRHPKRGKKCPPKKKKERKIKSCTALAQFCCSLNSYSPPVCLHPTEVFLFFFLLFLCYTELSGTRINRINNPWVCDSLVEKKRHAEVGRSGF